MLLLDATKTGHLKLSNTCDGKRLLVAQPNEMTATTTTSAEEEIKDSRVLTQVTFDNEKLCNQMHARVQDIRITKRSLRLTLEKSAARQKPKRTERNARMA